MTGTSAVASPQSITLSEWQRRVIDGVALPGDAATRATIAWLKRRQMLVVTELKSGLALETTSFVGRVRLGEFTIQIAPKIDQVPLLRLLLYTYNLRDLHITGDPAAFTTSPATPFVDLLILPLLAEVTSLLARGLRREYVARESELASPRGRIDLGKVARETAAGRVRATLPCRAIDLDADHSVNRALLAGLTLAASLTDDNQLRVAARRLIRTLETQVSATAPIALPELLRRAQRSSNRLTRGYDPALTLIGLLAAGHGPELEPDRDSVDEPSTAPQLPGFLFDMNRFFQALLLRLLRAFARDGFVVRSEQALNGVFAYTAEHNPHDRRPPTPRPDFTLVHRAANGADGDERVAALIDAKYRDLWMESLPREMLYQMTIYAALGSGASGDAILLYPTTAADAREQRIRIRARHPARVLLRPVRLDLLADSLSHSERLRALVDSWLDGVAPSAAA